MRQKKAVVPSGYEFMKKVASKRKTIRFFEGVRCPGGVTCIHCQSKRIAPKKSRLGVYQCKDCRKDFSVQTGAVFERSKIPLRKWFYAVYLLQTARKGISGLQGKMAVRLMKDLSVGNVEAYRSRKRGIGDDDMKKGFQFVNNDGDSILHFLVRLERFESLQQVYSPNVERVFIEEVMDIYETLPKWKFMKLLTSKSKEGFSPVEEAAISQAALESPNDHRKELSSHLSERAISNYFGTPIPSQNRGLAYKALQVAVGSYSWPSRAAFDAMILALPPLGVGILAYSAGNDILAEIGAAAAVAACGVAFKRLSDSGRVRKALSLR